MSFSTYVPSQRPPKQLTAEGKAIYDDAQERWALYQQVERIQQDAADAKGEAGRGEAETAKAPARTPQRVIDTLLSAKGELDVILDLINLVEQQQFASIAHVPHRPNPATDAEAATLALLRRRSQLGAAAERLREGGAKLRLKCSVEDAFLADLAALRVHWPLGRVPTGGGAGFFIDLALRAPGVEPRQGVVAGTHPSGGARYALVPDAAGAACLVAPGVDGGRRLVKGVEAIATELQRLLATEAWRAVVHVVESEVQTGNALDDTNGAVAAVRRMAAAALAATAGGRQHEGMGPEAVVGGGLEAQDVAAFCSTPVCQAMFEGRALRWLAEAIQVARVPALVLQARSASATGNGSASASGTLLRELTAWLKHAALRAAAERSLLSQAAASGAEVRPLAAPDALEAVWEVGGAGGSGRGVLVVRGRRLLWEGPAPPGTALEIGRRQLPEVVTWLHQYSGSK